ncbi:MAG: LuxE/PaaK family acyltransferase [Candidatus Helarchaeota archaeon]
MTKKDIFEDFRIQVKGTSNDCNFYKNLCLEQEYDIDQTINESNIDEIPYVNWNYFKESHGRYHKLLRIPYENLSYWTLSSSTTGDPSLVGRGKIDIEVFKQNYKTIFQEFSNMDSIQRLILFAPTLLFMNNMPGSWMGKRGFLFYRDITSIWKNYDIVYLLKFRLSKVILYYLTHFKGKAFIELDGKLLKKSLKAVEKQKIPTLIANSAPLMYKNFSDYQKKYKHGFDMDETFRVQTGGGGWSGIKGRINLGHKIDKADFFEKMMDFFNIPIENFADLFGATETPIACGGHWSKKYEDIVLHLNKNQGRIIVRDINTLEKIKKTKNPGILEILTPYGVDTYAGVSVLLDDIVEIVDFNRCAECGREGIVFRVTGKLTPEIGKGCTSFQNLYPFKIN